MESPVALYTLRPLKLAGAASVSEALSSVVAPLVAVLPLQVAALLSAGEAGRRAGHLELL